MLQNITNDIIIYEGTEGVGKTTIAKALVEELNKEGIKAVYLREPGSNAVSEKIRNLIFELGPNIDLLTQNYLFSAARNELYKTTIRQAISEGNIVVLDRSFITGLAYQGEYQYTSDLYTKITKDLVKEFNIKTTAYILDVSHETIRMRTEQKTDNNSYDVNILEHQSSYADVYANAIHGVFKVDVDFEFVDIEGLELNQSVYYLKYLLMTKGILFKKERECLLQGIEAKTLERVYNDPLLSSMFDRSIIAELNTIDLIKMHNNLVGMDMTNIDGGYEYSEDTIDEESYDNIVKLLQSIYKMYNNEEEGDKNE